MNKKLIEIKADTDIYSFRGDVNLSLSFDDDSRYGFLIRNGQDLFQLAATFRTIARTLEDMAELERKEQLKNLIAEIVYDGDNTFLVRASQTDQKLVGRYNAGKLNEVFIDRLDSENYGHFLEWVAGGPGLSFPGKEGDGIQIFRKKEPEYFSVNP